MQAVGMYMFSQVILTDVTLFLENISHQSISLTYMNVVRLNWTVLICMDENVLETFLIL